MGWKAKMQLFEQIRREYEFGDGTVRGIARASWECITGWYCQALSNTAPPTRRRGKRKRNR
jgi:hypothetical protein